jgi:endogenous inhibitor of DNA gyrase (YacG/DUF329 family)
MADLGAWVTEGYRIPGGPDEGGKPDQKSPEDEGEE